jgi:competence protein ComEC
LAVGHGACVVLELPGDQTIVYDAGSLGSPSRCANIVSSFLWSRRIDRIDALVISHPDIDHYNAVPRLLERIPIDVVYVSPMMFDPLANDGQQTAPEFLRQALLAAEVPLREIWIGDCLRTQAKSVSIDVLHPPEFGYLGRDNANSVVLSVTFEGRRILLPGDLEAPGLDALMSNPPIDCDILLAPHHGSNSSNPPGFAAWSTPEWVVMSGRGGLGTLAASRSYRIAGARALQTAEAGAVTFQLDDDGVKMTPFRAIPASE